MLYNVQMKRYTATEARMRMADMLDSAERGESVLIERKGVRFQILPAVAKPSSKRASKRPTKKAPILEILDEAIERGDWTWKDGPEGLTFARRTPRWTPR
jgi:antitoxin (DNA-binding transcriptional repressor) of toxin-antitoxin stability system